MSSSLNPDEFTHTQQERRKILELVAEGSLTIEQADQLLETFSAQSATFVEKRPDLSLHPMGFTTFTGEQLADLEDYEVDAEYIREMHEAGLRDLTVKQLI